MNNQAHIAILGQTQHQQHWPGWTPEAGITWCPDADSLMRTEADAYLSFLPLPHYNWAAGKTLVLGETIPTFAQMELPATCKAARFSAWPTLWQRPLWEIAATEPEPTWLPPIMQQLNQGYTLVADTPGLLAPTVIAMLVNEAYYGLADDLCTPADLDTAMKLGTNYPYGPLEWANLIGHQKLAALLQILQQSHPRYAPHPLLLEEASRG